MWTTEQLSYFAGIIDGEGSICVDLQRASEKFGRKHDYYTLRLSIVNTNKELMEWLVKNFSGSYYQRRPKAGYKICYTYRIYGHKLADLIVACIPYLIVKRPHAEIVNKFRTTVGKTGWNVSQEIVNYREQLYLEIKKLNKTGDHTISPLSP